MSFGMITLNQSTDAMQNYTTWIYIVHIKTEDVYEDIKNDVEKIFDTPNHTIERPLPKGKNKK